MQHLNLTWTEATSLRLWEVEAMAGYLEDMEKRRELKERDRSRLR